jgi:hypothetical protein
MSRNVNTYPRQKIGDDLYEIIAQYPVDKIKDSELVGQWLNVEHIFKSNKTGVYIFCNKIKDLLII